MVNSTQSQGPGLRRRPELVPAQPASPDGIQEQAPVQEAEITTDQEKDQVTDQAIVSTASPASESVRRLKNIKEEFGVPNISFSSKQLQDAGLAAVDMAVISTKHTSKTRAWVRNALKASLTYIFTAFLVIYLIGAMVTIFTLIWCNNPGLNSALPLCTGNKNAPNQLEFQRLSDLQLKLEEVQEISAEGATLHLFIKRGEMAIREVAIAVELSNLPSKEPLGKELNTYQKQARAAGNDLRRFNYHMDRTIINIISTNELTAQALDEIIYDSNRGAVAKFLALVPFHGIKQSTEAAIATLFMEHISQVKGDVDNLIAEAVSYVTNLENMEAQLWRIHSVSERDRKGVSSKKHKETKRFAHVFGLNSEVLGNLEEQSDILRALTEQRAMAYAQVSGVLESLKIISNGLEDLRESASVSRIVFEAQKTPLEIQADIIRKGLRRLHESRDKTRQKKEDYMNKIQEQLINAQRLHSLSPEKIQEDFMKLKTRLGERRST